MVDLVGKSPTLVSIRSPCRSKGDDYITESQAADLEFQSAPLAEARGDDHVAVVADHLSLVSIRSPCRSKGRFAG